MNDNPEVTVDQLVTQAAEQRAELHGLVYHVGTKTSPPPEVEGLDHIDIGNVRVYGPAGWKLGFLIHNQFRPLMPHKFVTLSEVRTSTEELIKRREAERIEGERLAEITRRHRLQAREESDALMREAQEQKEAPESQ